MPIWGLILMRNDLIFEENRLFFEVWPKWLGSLFMLATVSRERFVTFLPHHQVSAQSRCLRSKTVYFEIEVFSLYGPIGLKWALTKWTHEWELFLTILPWIYSNMKKPYLKKKTRALKHMFSRQLTWGDVIHAMLRNLKFIINLAVGLVFFH